ncbi:MAG: biotin--[acetyl-CoA-carboxylase] ligase [Clostridiales bacterium]|nr:biotin--[acetyl-CoA-carboxylase] ligase [Clostridiales bacterium]
MRDKILEILMNNSNDFLSGEVISTQLGITRAAVWKHIKSLQGEGFEIESKSRLGYRLMAIPESLDQVTLREAIKTKVMGKNLEVHQTIDSTNNRARDLALEGADEGTLVISETQSMGRGRLGRDWISPKGKGIWMSLILKPDLPPDQAPRITAIVAVALRKALNKATGLDVGIKWPNDIIINAKKVCGILTEIQADIDRIHYLVVGIGINVNMLADDFPPEIASTATSLRIAMNAWLDRRWIIALVMEEIEDIYLKYTKNKDFRRLLDQYREYSVTLNKSVRVIGRDMNFEGFALDFDTDGSLLVKREDGSITKVLSGDVSVRGEDGYV